MMRSLCISSLLLALVLTGCAPQTATTPTTPTAPTPPAVKVAQDVNLLAQSLDTALTGLMAARDQGKIPAADVAIAQKAAAAIAITGKQLNAELRTSDDWTVMVVKLRDILKTAAIAAVNANVPTSARSYLAAVITIYNSIAAGVGGQTI